MSVHWEWRGKEGRHSACLFYRYLSTFRRVKLFFTLIQSGLSYDLFVGSASIFSSSAWTSSLSKTSSSHQFLLKYTGRRSFSIHNVRRKLRESRIKFKITMFKCYPHLTVETVPWVLDSSLLGPLGSVIKDSLSAGLKWTTVFMKSFYWAKIVMSCVQISSQGTDSHSEFEACLQN